MSEGVVKKEEKARKFQAIRGTRDLLPAETELWNRVEQSAREVFGTFGFGEIRTPIFEETELFARSIGAETDVVSKEMYSFHENPQLVEGRDFIEGRDSTQNQIDQHAYVILYFKYCEEAVLATKGQNDTSRMSRPRCTQGRSRQAKEYLGC